MGRDIGQIALVIPDYDEAIDYYVRKLNFVLLEDTKLSSDKRWVRIAPDHDSACCLLLAKAKDETQQKAIGNQSGGRVFLFLYTEDIAADHENLVKNQIEITRPLSEQPYGKVLVFRDKYGNLWDLIERKEEQ